MAFSFFKPGMSWADESDRESQKRKAMPKAAAAEKATYKPPQARIMGTPIPSSPPSRPSLGDLYGSPLQIFNGARWVLAIDPEGDYGGPYWDMCELFKDTRYRSDMMDIYGVPFQPSLVEECRDSQREVRLRFMEDKLRRIRGSSRAPSRNRGSSRESSRNRSRGSRNRATRSRNRGTRSRNRATSRDRAPSRNRR